MICGVCGNFNPIDAEACLRCGSRGFTVPSGSGPAPPGSSAPTVYRLGWLANALTVLFSITALLLVINIFVPHRISVRPVTEIYVNVRGSPPCSLA